MSRSITVVSLYVALPGLSSVLAAQVANSPQGQKPETKPWNAPLKNRNGPPPVPPRPGLFFREEWQKPSVEPPASNHDPCCWLLTQASVANSNLVLHVYGATAEMALVGVRGSESNPIHAYTGLCSAACAISFRDKSNFVDLTRGKIRWVAKAAALHTVRPMIRLADGTYLLGDFDEGNSDEWRATEFYPSELRWIRMDSDRVTPFGNWIYKPDLSRVDEVGWADLLPGAGHNVGHDDVAAFEVFGSAVQRRPSADSQETR